MDLGEMGMDPVLINALHELLDLSEETPEKSGHHTPSRAYIRDRKAMAATPADVINILVEDDNVLVVSGERKREKADKEQRIKYVRMERRHGKYLKKFALGDNADTEKITAVYKDGVLTVTMGKRPPPEPKKAKTIQVQIG
ncbi:hypothetical protein CDL15_Pgr022095 [Punica granatum]|uniref:SHSP domain-containing protein n=1 Tax=Punica granatum TaxID=22663 RepID=A0A218VTD4_PUNGR|nr:hypothetical protein CDL15_Pgr022095 [Punica granatum]